jgi:hypothetical protein
MGVIEINQTADPGAFLVEARSRFFGDYSIFLRFSTPGSPRRGIFLVYNQMFNQPTSHQTVQQRYVVERFPLCSEGHGFESHFDFGRKPKKEDTFERKRLQKAVCGRVVLTLL